MSGTTHGWTALAERVFAEHPSMATVSIVSSQLLKGLGYDAADLPPVLQASTAALPLCIVNDAVIGLVGSSDVKQQIEAATKRGLHHAWIVSSDGQGAQRPDDLWPRPSAAVDLFVAPLQVTDSSVSDAPIALGIDAEWLRGGESGAQVFVFEMLKAMAASASIDRIVLLSDDGAMPMALQGQPKMNGLSWSEAQSRGTRLDVLHRPYQPGVTTDFDRYRSVARAIALTVLDFIAYDNPSYHESPFAFRAYQRAFDAKVRAADQLFAISRHIGDRLQRQFAHQLLAPVQSILLGADHLDRRNGAQVPVPAALSGVASKQYLAVLGNDFAHKNRDFAVKVFAEMCDRGYAGRLVLAGFHLDAGSSYGYELQGAGNHADRVLRLGSLSSADKTWLLENAAAILYPTSSEGFGLIPFEAAALGTPAAFVRFGPLAETMPGVPAASAWSVTAFADHVFALLADPASFVSAVNAARHALTWERCAAETIAVYRQMLQPAATWHAAVAGRRGPSRFILLNETTAEWWRRAGGRVRRMTGRRFTQEGK